MVFKYFVAGEYGETYGRPHYHVAFFGIGNKDKNILQKVWSYGFIQVKPLIVPTMLYVAKYITKAPLGRQRKCLRDISKVPAFQKCSHGIGLRWIKENAERFGDVGISRQGRRIPLPRYYIKKAREAGVSLRVVEEVRADRMQMLREYYKQLRARGIESVDEVTREKELQRLTKIEIILKMDELKKSKDRQ